MTARTVRHSSHPPPSRAATPVLVRAAACGRDGGLDAFAARVARRAFLGGGHGATRLLVEEGVRDGFVAALAAQAARLPVARAHPEWTHDLVASALADGAELRCGGRPGGADHYAPTVLDYCHGAMRVVTEPDAGPVATVETFKSRPEAAALWAAAAL